MDAINLFILGLATWRISSIIQRETIAAPFRRLLGETFDEMLQTNVYKDTFIAHLISCFWCVSVWGGIVCVILYLYYPVLLLPFAGSALAILFDKVI